MFHNWFLEMYNSHPVILLTDFDTNVSHIQSEEFPIEVNVTSNASKHTFYFRNEEDVKEYDQAQESFDDSVFLDMQNAVYRDCFGDMITHGEL